MTRKIDFTRGNLMQQLILFSIPLVLGELLQNFYNSVDAMVVGNFVSDTALAAVSVCETLSNLLVGFFNGMSIGSIVVISRAFGSKKGNLLQQTIRISFTFSTLLGIALSILGICNTELLIHLVDVPENVYAEAVIYLRIYLAGLMFTVIYNVSAGILRATGDSGTPVLILLFTCCINALLDLLFVVKLELGVAGVSLATVISQFLSVTIMYQKISRQCGAGCFSLRETVFFGKKTILELLNIGVPSGLQNSLITFSNLFIWRYINQFDYVATAGIGIAQRLDKFIAMPCKAFGTTVTTCVSQNMGAGKPERANVGVRRCLILSTAVTITLEIVVLFFSWQCVSLFNDNQAVVLIGTSMIQTILPFYILFAIREILYGILRGHGYTRVTTVLSLVGMIGFRQIFLAVSMKIHPVITNIYWCYPIAWGSTMLLIYCYYRFVKSRPSWDTAISKDLSDPIEHNGSKSRRE